VPSWPALPHLHHLLHWPEMHIVRPPTYRHPLRRWEIDGLEPWYALRVITTCNYGTHMVCDYIEAPPLFGQLHVIAAIKLWGFIDKQHRQCHACITIYTGSTMHVNNQCQACKCFSLMPPQILQAKHPQQAVSSN